MRRSSFKQAMFTLATLSLFLMFSFIGLLVSACSPQLRYPDLPQTGFTHAPKVTFDETTGTASMEVTVLIYNVCGLPWPLGCGKSSRDTDESGKRIPIECFRSSALKDIGDTLAEMRSRGTEPDIILLQEAFMSTSAEIPGRGGYTNWVAGPGRKDRGSVASPPLSSRH